MKWRKPVRDMYAGVSAGFSTRRRVLRVLLSAGLLSGLLGTPAAVAADNPTLPTGVRGQIVGYWETGGVGLKVAAEQALLGSDADIQKFLDEAQSIQYDDDRVETARLAMTGGPGLRQAAKDAMLASPSDLETFLLYGYEAPLDEDRKVDIARLVNVGGAGIREQGKAALLGTADDRELFLNTGQYEAQEDDNRVETARLAMAGGTNVKAAAKVALSGTPDDIREFLEIGQFVARNRDQEHMSIAQLIDEAAKAGKQATDATKQAEEASLKAVAASKLAKEAAVKAAAETEAAKNDSKKAAVKAQQAAEAARAAADAAQVAIGAANAASSAARRAALAAAQTASAAAAAGAAANKAFNAAIAAADDEANASEALAAAKDARAAAAAVDTAAAAAQLAGEASANSAIAADSASSANDNARAAADAADDANDYADAAGLHSDAARQAAAEARRHAAVADLAADRSAALARRAATAAYGARDAANSAATHARRAADFAEEAAAQAGNTATYAAVSKKNADAAMAASTAVAAAVSKANEVFALARETEEADLQTRTEAAIERAKSMQMSTEIGISQSAATQIKALSLNDTATQLAEDSASPDVDIPAIATKGRQLALQALELLGPWHQEAAARALSGTDQDVLDYVRTRWKEANDNDVRQSVVNLSAQSPYASVRTAATTVLDGTTEQINAFHVAGQYEAGLDDMKVDVAKLAESGGPSVSDKAKAVLTSGTGKALATFLQISQYGERLTDEKVVVARLAETGGPELSTAAKIALAGPPQAVHEFFSTGQYMAQRKDDLAKVHVNQVKRLLAEGALIAANARADAWRAAEAAALAKKATDDANTAKVEAQKSSAQADKYKDEAEASANAASQSAADAATSASTARSAANRADANADAAESSAFQAEFSASYARNTAAQATTAANDAHASAVAAGASSTEADKVAKAAWKSALTLAEQEYKAAMEQAEKEHNSQESESDYHESFCMDIFPYVKVPGLNTIICTDLFDRAKDVLTDPETWKAAAWELSGLADIKACYENPNALDCIMAVVGVTPAGKLKLLAKIKKGLDTVKTGRAVRRTVSCLIGAAHSFPAGTKVLIADGTSRPIEQVRPGDLVTATDPITGKTGDRPVTQTIRTPDDRDFTEVTLADGSTLTSTSHHPYWSESDQKWKAASALEVGDALHTSQKTSAIIAHTRNWQGRQDAYDLTVEDLHTYYVSTGTTNVLVHNTNEDCGWVQTIFDELPKFGKANRKTYGKIRDENGKILPGAETDELRELMSGEHDSLYDEANELLRTSQQAPWPSKGVFPPASHVESKYAAWMKKSGVQHAKVVINNNEGVCNDYMNCRKAVEAILPAGWTMKVYYPGDGSPVTIVGKRVRP